LAGSGVAVLAEAVHSVGSEVAAAAAVAVGASGSEARLAVADFGDVNIRPRAWRVALTRPGMEMARRMAHERRSR